jgi:hypothetical protein
MRGVETRRLGSVAVAGNEKEEAQRKAEGPHATVKGPVQCEECVLTLTPEERCAHRTRVGVRKTDGYDQHKTDRERKRKTMPTIWMETQQNAAKCKHNTYAHARDPERMTIAEHSTALHCDRPQQMRHLFSSVAARERWPAIVWFWRGMRARACACARVSPFG